MGGVKSRWAKIGWGIVGGTGTVTVCSDALNATLLRSVVFSMSQNRVHITSVCEQIIGPLL